MELEWRKATNCASGACVEVAFTQSFVHVRDSNKPNMVLDFTYDEWEAFTEGAKLGEFDIV
jgi:hypothetical protein